MKPVKSLIKVLLVGCTCIALSSGSCLGAEPDDTAKIAKKMLDAIVADDFKAFAEHGDATLKSDENKDILKTVSPHLLTPLKKGFEISYLGTLKVQGHDVTLWKITYKTGSDDTLLTLYMKDGQVSGFWLK